LKGVTIMAFDPEAVREFERSSWNRNAAGYEASFAPATTPFISALLDAIGVGRGDLVLDVCCGSGRTAGAAAQRGAVAKGLDFSRAMVEVARREQPSATFDEGDAEALPYADGTFDAVVCNFGIHHVPRPTLALREACRVLRPGGRVAFTVWAAGSESIGLALLSDAIARHGDRNLTSAPPTGPDGVRSVDDCIRALSEAGFGRVRASTMCRRWRLANGRELFDALRLGTAGSSARIAAQPVDALPAIIADVEKNAERYRDAEGVAVPMVAILAFGVKDAPEV
jgi:SAM-dependent methyltransferase